MAKIGEVVLSRKDIANLDSRCADVGPMAEENHARHEAWYADFCARERAVWEARVNPQSKVRAKVEAAVSSNRYRPGTIGDLIKSKLG